MPDEAAAPEGGGGGSTAIILAGGLGTRLRESVSDRPKVLAEVCGRPYLAFLLDQMVDAGVRSIVLCTGYMGGLVEDAFGASYRGARLDYSLEPEPLGTGGALALALERGLVTTTPTIVLNGDSYCDVDVRAYLAWAAETGARSALVLKEVDDASRYGRVEVGDGDALVSFREKEEGSGSGWINAGIYLLDRELLESIPGGRAVSLEREILPAWIGRGLSGFRTQGRFLDIGTPRTYSEAQRFFAGESTLDHQ